MTLNEIKEALEAGKTVKWSNASYSVVKDDIGQYLVHYKPKDIYWGLTHTDGVTLNGEEKDFYIEAAIDENDLITIYMTYPLNKGDKGESPEEPNLHSSLEDATEAAELAFKNERNDAVEVKVAKIHKDNLEDFAIYVEDDGALNYEDCAKWANALSEFEEVKTLV